LSPTNLLENSLKIGNYFIRRSFDRLRIKIDKDEWEFSPAIINAFYNPENNQICRNIVYKKIPINFIKKIVIFFTF
jgi:predicted metalloendopeptidase